MTSRLVVRSAAASDILGVALWYQQRSPGLGLEFLRAADVTLTEIACMHAHRNPQRWQERAGD